MSDFDRGLAGQGAVARPDMAVDSGLRAFMLGVYNKVALGLVLSAVLAVLTSSYPPARALLYRTDGYGHLVGFTILGLVVAIAPLPIIMFQRFARSASPSSAAFTYWAVVSLIGASFGAWFLRYNLGSIFETFLVTATAFGGLSLVGYTTKRDLTGFGSFLILGLIGVIVAMIVMLVFHSPALMFAINVAGVVVFAGLIAFQTQRLKLDYYQLGGDQAALGAATSWGALSLYLDFVNLFRFLLMFMGGGRR